MLCLALTAVSSLGSPVDDGKGGFAAARLFDKRSNCRGKIIAERQESDVEEQVRALLCQAERAEGKAAWHEERAQLWEEIAERQHLMGDLVSAGEPLAAFFARTHRHQKAKKLRQAQSLRQKVKGLGARLY